jgi:small subunit ribosomal protein S4
VISIGDPRRLKRKFKKPKRKFERDRIVEELQFIGKYGLRNKREFWKMRSIVGNWRDLARRSRTLPREQAVQVQQTLIKKLNKLGILGPEADLDDVLLIGVEDLLKRRLQSLVFEKGLAQTIYQARQLVVHRHIQINGKIINAPSYIVKTNQDDYIGFSATSPLSAATKQAKTS